MMKRSKEIQVFSCVLPLPTAAASSMGAPPSACCEIPNLSVVAPVLTVCQYRATITVSHLHFEQGIF